MASSARSTSGAVVAHARELVAEIPPRRLDKGAGIGYSALQVMRVFYDSARNRLVCVRESASPEFWDRHWDRSPEALARAIRAGGHHRALLASTRRCLSRGSRVLEGGAGIGQNVYALERAGYRATGVDFAPRTVEAVGRAVPSLDIRQGDVRALAFDDSSFDGYWSVGVIEHFYDGFGPIVREMRRVLRAGGWLFLTFPYLSPLRRWKIARHRYPAWTGDEYNRFYQFMLDADEVAAELGNAGLCVVERRPLDGIKGLKDEVGLVQRPLQWLYDGRHPAIRAGRYALGRALARATGHSVLLVARNDKGGR